MSHPDPKHKKTVLHLIDTGGPGGAETIFLELVEGLDDSKWRSITALPELDWLSSTLVARGHRPILLPTSGSFDVRYLRGIWKLARAEGVDLIHTHLLTTSVYGSVVGALAGLPVVCTFHGIADVTNDPRVRLKMRILDRRRSHVVFVSESLRVAVAELAGRDADRWHVIYNGIDLTPFPARSGGAFRRDLRIGSDEILVGAVGNIRFSKDYPNFLRAAAALRERTPLYRFVVVGDTRSPLMTELERLRDELGLGDSVTFAGFREDIPNVMADLDVYVVSSSAEGFSLTTVQAMASGLPVVATRCGGPEEILEDGVTGLLVPPAEPVALADAIHRLATDPDQSARLGRAAREHAVTNFSIQRMVHEYESLYERALGLPAHQEEPSRPREVQVPA